MSSAAFVTPEEAASDDSGSRNKPSNTGKDNTQKETTPTQDGASTAAGGASALPAASASAGDKATQQASGADEHAAALKIQKGFRGLQARTRVRGMRYPDLYPYSGPLAPAVLPPRKVARNPVFVGITTGRNSQCGCPGAHRQTIHFDTHGFPARLTGIYTEQSWVELLVELNAALRDTHLPLCPSSLLWICPVLGACAWWHWNDRLRKRRLHKLRQILRRESDALSQWGLHWKLKPLWSGVHEGRGDMVRVQIDLLMNAAAQTAVRRTMRRSLSVSQRARDSVSQRASEPAAPAAPQQHKMEDGGDTAQLIAVQPKATSGRES